MSPRKDHAKQIFAAIRDVFILDWDPIGVMGDPEWPRDEYDSYISEVYAMLARGESAEFIAQHLRFIEQRLMGLNTLPSADRLNVAAKLKAIDIRTPDAD